VTDNATEAAATARWATRRRQSDAGGNQVEIVQLSLTCPASIDVLAQALGPLAYRESRFGVILTVDGLALDRKRDAWPEVRKLPGGRARFGTWCSGVAYVFSGPLCESQARIHLVHAGRLWGTRVHATQDADVAQVWLEQRMRTDLPRHDSRSGTCHGREPERNV
jgi:hypothetical protein